MRNWRYSLLSTKWTILLLRSSPILVNLSTQHTFTEHLLHARHWVRLRNRKLKKTDTLPSRSSECSADILFDAWVIIKHYEMNWQIWSCWTDELMFRTDRCTDTWGLQWGNQRWWCTPEAPPEMGCLSWWSLNILCFENGRFWLVINKEGNMVTARQEPRLVLISLTCESDTLTLSAAYTKDLPLPVKTPATNVVHRCR